MVFLSRLPIHKVKFKFQSGFTLIEMIVVFAVITILSTIAIVSFVNYNKSQILQVGVSELQSAFNLARSRAVSQTKPSQCDQQILNGYKIVLNVSQNTYDMYAVCSDTFEYKIGVTSKLPKNVVFSPDPTSTSFFFPIIVSGVQTPGTIYLTAYEVTRTITVDSTGNLR